MSKYVFIHLFNDRSGSPKVLSQVVQVLHQGGHDVEVLTSDHSNGFLSEVPGKKRVIFYRRSENKLFTLGYYLLSQLYLFFYCLRYFRQDVVFYINTMMPFGGALSARIMRKKVIYHVHETSIKPKLLKWFLRLVIKLCASKIIYVSWYLLGKEGFSNKEQCVVYNCLDTDFLNERVAGVPVRPFNVLMVCSLKKYKGVMEYLKLAEMLNVREDLSFNLVVNAERRELDCFFLGIKIPSNLKIHTRQSDLTKFYSRSALLLNLSRPDEWIETFGLTLLEAMGGGVPVIAPPVGGPAEIVRDGSDGYLISCYDLEKVASCIETLADDALLYERMSANALVRAREFGWDEFSKRIVDVVNG